MPHNVRFEGTMVLLLAAALAGCVSHTPTEDARVLLSRPMPGLDGAHLQVTLVEVTYGASAGSAPHRHTCPVLGYVQEGVLRSQVSGQPVRIYRAGQSFYEAPNAVHAISTNASNREPVRFLAAFVCDHPEPRTVPAAGDRASR